MTIVINTKQAVADLDELRTLSEHFAVDLYSAIKRLSDSDSIFVAEVDWAVADIADRHICVYQLHKELLALLAALRMRANDVKANKIDKAVHTDHHAIMPG